MSELYVTIEGIDGCGKTSVAQALMNIYPDAVGTTEPTDEFWTGQVTRESFEERDVAEMSRFYLFMADRAHHVERFIEPKLDEGKLIISDRGPDSTRAYQPITSGVSTQLIEENLGQFRQPDLTLWLDVGVDDAAERTAGDDAFENRELQVEVANNYFTLWLAFDRIVKIDAEQSLEDVVADCKEAIDERI